MIKRGVEDVMAWRLTKGGAFIVNSFYSSLVGRFLKSFAIGIVWNPLVSMRVNFFCLGSSLRKNSTSRSAKKDGLVFSCLPSRCYFCKGEEESTNHILLHCPKATFL